MSKLKEKIDNWYNYYLDKGKPRSVRLESVLRKIDRDLEIIKAHTSSHNLTQDCKIAWLEKEVAELKAVIPFKDQSEDKLDMVKRVRFADYDEAEEQFIKQNIKHYDWLGNGGYPTILLDVYTQGEVRGFKALTKKRCIEKAFEYYGWEV